MSGLDERENKRNNPPVVKTIIENNKKNTNKKDTNTKKAKKENAVIKLRQQSYYLTEEHIKALEVRTFKNKMAGTGETDKSALVRAALDRYLKVDIEEIAKSND